MFLILVNPRAADGSTAVSRASAAPDACREPLIPLSALGELLAHFAMPPRMSMGRLRPMNILDPLQELNNLGRSVSKASHQRIVFVMKHCTGTIDRVMKAVVWRSLTLVLRLQNPTMAVEIIPWLAGELLQFACTHQAQAESFYMLWGSWILPELRLHTCREAQSPVVHQLS